MSIVNTNAINMSFPPSFPDGPTGEQRNDLLIFFEAFREGPFGYLFVDENMHTVYYNDKVGEVLAVDPLLLKHRNVFDFLLEEEHPRLQELKDHATTQFQEPLRLVKVRGIGQTVRLVTIYLKQILVNNNQTKLYVMLFLKNDFNPITSSKEESNAFYRAIIETQEAEREFVSASLHDNIAQELYAIRINLQRFIMSSGHEAEIMPIKKMLNDTIFKVRNISNDLAPAVLRDMGFHQAIDDMIFRLTRGEVKFNVRIDQTISTVRKELLFCSYQVIQELFNNCLKHANAKKVMLQVRSSMDAITIVVEDDGKGFAGEVESSLRLGTGLRNIRNRIALYAGTMDMASTSVGSKIQIKLYT